MKVDNARLAAYAVGFAVVFTGLDYFLHQLISTITIVPAAYYSGKVLITSAALFGLIKFFPKLSTLMTALIVTLALQIRYTLTQPSEFTVVTGLLHYVLLYSLLTFSQEWRR